MSEFVERARSWWRRHWWPAQIRQLRRERDDYRSWWDEWAGAVMVLWGDHRDEINAEVHRRRREVSDGGS